MPVYFVIQLHALTHAWPLIVLAAAGTLFGTIFGVRVLGRIPERVFRRIVAALLLALGAYMTFVGGAR
jgi:uncharacterized membrane protein YfcA